MTTGLTALEASPAPLPGAAGAERAVLGYSAAPSFDYVPGLDGFRALSVLFVVISHAGMSRLIPAGSASRCSSSSADS